jgi:hypothetical protein
MGSEKDIWRNRSVKLLPGCPYADAKSPTLFTPNNSRDITGSPAKTFP